MLLTLRGHRVNLLTVSRALHSFSFKTERQALTIHQQIHHVATTELQYTAAPPPFLTTQEAKFHLHDERD